MKPFRGNPTRLFWSVLLILVGGLLLLSNLGIISESIWDFWPVLLIAVGIKFLFEAYARSKPQS